MTSIKEAVEFIRKNNILKEWTDTEIYNEIAHAIFNNTLLYTVNKNGVLSGIVFGTDFKEEKRLHIKCLAGHGNLKSYIELFKRRYPDYFITAYRRGKFVTLKI